MSGIQIFADPNRHLSDSMLIFSKISDYPKLYHTVREMLANNISRSDIIVQNQQLLSWLRELNNFEPNDMLTFREMTLRQFVTNTWGIIPPSYLLDDDLKEILDIFPVLKDQSDFEKSVLEHYFLFSFDFTELTLTTLEKICNEAKFADYRNKSQLKCIKLILDHQKEKALKYNKNISILIEILFESPEKFIKIVSSFAVLKGYTNELRNRFLEGYIYELSSLSIKQFYPNTNTLPIEITNAIRVELNSLLTSASTLDEVAEIIRCTSGILESEFETLVEFINSQIHFDRNKLIVVVKSHFIRLLTRKPELSTELDLLFSPDFPSAPNFEDAKTWFEWAENEYLPYRRWQETRKENNELLDSYGILFSDWIAKNYFEIKYSYPNTVMNLLPNIKQKIDQQSFTLLLIIDNIGLRWNNHLINLFKKNSINLLQKENLIAAIPTETRISKTALLSANYTFSKNEQDYRKLIEQKTSEQFQNKQLFYTTKVSDLKQLPEDVNFAILNYLMIDEYMHMDQNKMASPKLEVISNELNGLVDLVCKSLAYRPQIDIYVVSDHGSVKISNDKVINVDDIFLGDKIIEGTERYICVSDEQLNRFRSKLETIGYIFERIRYNLDANYVILKGYNSFRKNTADQYLHGGVSPEEILVPLLHFHRSTHTVIPPNVLIRDNTFRFNVKSQLLLLIENTNQIPVQNLQLTILSPFVSVDNDILIVEKIDSMTKIDVNIENVRIMRKGSIVPTELSISIQYDFASKQYSSEIKLPIVIKSMQENTFDFDF
ncbi:PglZ domain-containing protein [Paenibacillus sp. FSL A5-0031]|uniref:PglZ domain-containing protein n=1 Tax=Paenibacillus sp. FSL A5-0031 TaxID=1920420 RepID=UPI0011864AC1|nr:PglZ domain-containing protein [Paenibacillus sp. FSL A5-0031]